MNSEEALRMGERNEGIELFRIVAMFLIVVSHVLGRVQTFIPKGEAKYWILWSISPLVSCAVNSYALISGYVGWNKKSNYGRILELWCQVAFYTVGLTLLLGIIRPDVLYVERISKQSFR